MISVGPDLMSSKKEDGESNRIRLIRESYDRVAEEYARRISSELARKPFDRDLLKRFLAEVGDSGEICDVGCGPGHVSRYLRDLGANVFGLDISPRMIEEARQLNPDIRFQEGNMMSLDLPDAELVGIVSFYSICNLPEESLSTVFREMWRVLKGGGIVLLGFHTGDETLHRDELWGKAISMDFFLYDPQLIKQYLKDAGFIIENVFEREPYEPEVEYQSRRAYIFARKPARD